MRTREAQIAETFVTLADTLVNGFDVTDLLHTLASTCVELLGVDAAGILLADTDGTLQVVGASEEQLRLLELFELQNDEGPCMDCYRSGRPVAEPDLAAADRWPRFAPVALEAGFASVDAVPMRLRQEVIGALNLFRHDTGGVAPGELRLAQALADVAAIALIQARLLHESELVAEQLQTALNSRVLIEQAKGMVSEQGHVGIDAAFERLRDHARAHSIAITDLAENVVAGEITAAGLAPVES